MIHYPILRIAHVLFWVLYAVLEHLSHVMYGQNHWQGSLFAPMMAMVGTAMIALLYERTEDKPLLTRLCVLLPPGFVIMVIWHNLTRILHHHITLEGLFAAPPLDWLAGSSYSVLLLLTWAGIFVSAYIYLQKKSQQEELALIKSTARDAQLQQLLYQLNPHFLFNVLNSIDVAILEKDTNTAHNMVVKLSSFLRSTLEHKFDNKIMLKQELALLNHFIDIEQQRFHQKISFESHIQPEALKAFVPPLILQPLLENAVKFSWQLGADCTISLNVVIDNKKLNIRIVNPFDDANTDKASGTNTGLENVANRLQLLYGDGATLQTNRSQGHFEAVLAIPFEVEV